MNVVRAISSEGFGRIRYHTEVRRRLETDRQVRRYFEGETTELPEFYMDQVRRDLGPLWKWLPRGALYHEPLAYLKSEQERARIPYELTAAVDPGRTVATTAAVAG
jgi:hypothetical protein